MDDNIKSSKENCTAENKSCMFYKSRLPAVTEKIISSCNEAYSHTHIGYEPIPSKGYVIEIIDRLREILFPGYFNKSKLNPLNLRYNIGLSVSVLFDMLSEQISCSLRHNCFRYDQACIQCIDYGHKVTLDFFHSIPDIQKKLSKDVSATYAGDPAAESTDEIIFSYPGIFAISIYRIGHRLYELNVPLLPRIMTEYAHTVTGIDIHPAAEIGDSFVIDHGTGVVIGETAIIGDNVRIYQGVTLGALSIPPDGGDKLKSKKRHPTIENDVIIYSGATILGGDTVIGANSIIGGNVWITESVPPNTKVIMKSPQLIYR